MCSVLAVQRAMPVYALTRSLTSMQALLGPDTPSMDAVQRTLLHHFSEVFDVELEPELALELASEIAPEIGSLGPPADATVLSVSGATWPSTPATVTRPTELAEPMPPAGFAWGGTS